MRRPPPSQAISLRFCAGAIGTGSPPSTPLLLSQLSSSSPAQAQSCHTHLHPPLSWPSPSQNPPRTTISFISRSPHRPISPPPHRHLLHRIASHRQAQETSSPSPLSVIQFLSRLQPPSPPCVDHCLQPSLSLFIPTCVAHTLIPIHHLPLHLQARTDPSHHHLGLASSITTLCRSTIQHASSSISHTTPSLPHAVISLSHQTPHIREERTSKGARQGLGISCHYHRGVSTSSSNGFVIQSKEPLPSCTKDTDGEARFQYSNPELVVRIEIVRKILEANPSLASRKNEKGFSALHLASSNGNLGVIKEFLGKDPNLSFLRDNGGRTPLHLAMIYNQVHVVKEFLLERSKPVSFNRLLVTDLINTADSIGDTVLHLAAKMNCLEIIELLLSKPGIKVNAANNEGNTAFDILEKIQVVDNGANLAVDTLKQIPASDNDEYGTIDVSEQIPARDSDGNVANDSYSRWMATVQLLKPREKANPSSLIDMQLKLMVVTGLILTVTFQAILSPPGGLWQDLSRGNHTNHIPGKAIQSETNAGLFTFFMAADALGFLVSLALIPIIMILRKEMMLCVNSLVVLTLISIEVAFILSLIMISDRKTFFRVEVFLLVLVTLVGIGWMQWKRKPQLKDS